MSLLTGWPVRDHIASHLQGLIALSEIASRALAPATNDPGTGIEVLNALLRVFLMLAPDPMGASPDEALRRVHIDRPSMSDMLADAFGPILREGGEEVEVALRLTSRLAAMHANLPNARAQIDDWRIRHATRVMATLGDPHDVIVFEEAYARLWPD